MDTHLHVFMQGTRDRTSCWSYPSPLLRHQELMPYNLLDPILSRCLDGVEVKTPET